MDEKIPKKIKKGSVYLKDESEGGFVKIDKINNGINVYTSVAYKKLKGSCCPYLDLISAISWLDKTIFNPQTEAAISNRIIPIPFALEKFDILPLKLIRKIPTEANVATARILFDREVFSILQDKIGTIII